MTYRPMAITKLLSPNDTGETGGHQAGILVPKGGDVLRFFPDLGCDTKNPRASLEFVDQDGKEWEFSFIYYNNKFFDSKGTRNEYRLTGMTAFFRENGLKSGDSITLKHIGGIYTISYVRCKAVQATIVTDASGSTRKRLVINNTWRVIDC